MQTSKKYNFSNSVSLNVLINEYKIYFIEKEIYEIFKLNQQKCEIPFVKQVSKFPQYGDCCKYVNVLSILDIIHIYKYYDCEEKLINWIFNEILPNNLVEFKDSVIKEFKSNIFL